jgi:phage gp29-like protein
VSGVRQVLGGHPEQGLTPQRLARLLREAEAGDATAYLELAEAIEERWLHYGSVLRTRKYAVSQLEITVEAASDAAADERDAELVREWLDRDELQDDLFDVMDAVGKGYSVCELIWRTEARRWWPERVEWRDPRWFGVDRVDGRTLRLRGESGQAEDLPAFKYICHRYKAKSGIGIRGGLARGACWPYLFQNYTVKDWVVFAEVYGQPLRVGKYHPGATTEEKDVLLRAVTAIGADAAAIIPENMLIEFIRAEGSATSADVYKHLVEHLDQSVSKHVLGQTATTDAIAGGHAVGREHQLVRQDIETADARALGGTLTRDLAIPLVILNHGPRERYPKIRIGRAEQTDMAQLTGALEKLVPLGLKVSMADIRTRMGLPEPKPDEELLTPPAPPPDPFAARPPGGGEPGGGGAERPPPGAGDDDGDDDGAGPQARRAAHAAGAAGPSVFDALAEGMADWEALTGPVLAPVRAEIAAASSLEELRDRLGPELAGMDSARLTELLARAGFAARTAGALGLDPEEDVPDA